MNKGKHTTKKIFVIAI